MFRCGPLLHDLLVQLLHALRSTYSTSKYFCVSCGHRVCSAATTCSFPHREIQLAAQRVVPAVLHLSPLLPCLARPLSAPNSLFLAFYSHVLYCTSSSKGHYLSPSPVETPYLTPVPPRPTSRPPTTPAVEIAREVENRLNT